MKIKTCLYYLYLLTTLLSMISCQHNLSSGTKYIKIQGSDTMLILAQRWAESYMQENPQVSIYVDGGGTAKGFEALIAGKIDLCTASRSLLPREARLLAESHSRLGVAHLVAKDALSIYLNPDNPVKNLTITQLKRIYSGKITSWREVGGGENPITVITRSPNSGTYSYFKEHILNNENYVKTADSYYSTKAIVNAVLENPYAIGYGGTAFGNNVYHCSIDNIAPTVENVLNDTYPIARYLYLYTLDTPKSPIKEFIDWIMKGRGQVIIAQVGFIPLFQPVVNPNR